MAISTTFYEDIHIEDKQDRENYVNAFTRGNYQTAFAILQKYSMKNKSLIADVINAITDKIVEVEALDDPTFKQDKIKFVYSTPVSPSVNEVFFWLDEEGEYDITQVGDILYIRKAPAFQNADILSVI